MDLIIPIAIIDNAYNTSIDNITQLSYNFELIKEDNSFFQESELPPYYFTDYIANLDVQIYLNNFIINVDSNYETLIYYSVNDSNWEIVENNSYINYFLSENDHIYIKLYYKINDKLYSNKESNFKYKVRITKKLPNKYYTKFIRNISNEENTTEKIIRVIEPFVIGEDLFVRLDSDKKYAYKINEIKYFSGNVVKIGNITQLNKEFIDINFYIIENNKLLFSSYNSIRVFFYKIINGYTNEDAKKLIPENFKDSVIEEVANLLIDVENSLETDIYFDVLPYIYYKDISFTDLDDIFKNSSAPFLRDFKPYFGSKKFLEYISKVLGYNLTEIPNNDNCILGVKLELNINNNEHVGLDINNYENLSELLKKRLHVCVKYAPLYVVLKTYSNLKIFGNDSFNFKSKINMHETIGLEFSDFNRQKNININEDEMKIMSEDYNKTKHNINNSDDLFITSNDRNRFIQKIIEEEGFVYEGKDYYDL